MCTCVRLLGFLWYYLKFVCKLNRSRLPNKGFTCHLRATIYPEKPSYLFRLRTSLSIR